MNRHIDRIVIHCSASDFGNTWQVSEWCNSGRWEQADCHFVVLNGYTEASQVKSKHPYSFLDGSVECGCALDKEPRFAPDSHTIGICLIGQPGKFSLRQYYAVRTIINVLCWHYDIALRNIISHTELDSRSECPGINMKYFRQFLKDDRYIEQLVGM